MRKITKFVKDHTILAVILGCLLTAFIAFATTGFSYVIQHEVKIEHLEKTNIDTKKFHSEIDDKLMQIQLDVNEIKTHMKYLIPKSKDE